jgi:hypothetical protein
MLARHVSRKFECDNEMLIMREDERETIDEGISGRITRGLADAQNGEEGTNGDENNA